VTVLTTDRLRLVQFTQGGAIRVVRDLLDGTNYRHVRDSFVITASPKQRLLTSPTRRFGGQRVGNELWENGALSATWVVNGATPGAAMTNASLLLQSMEDLTPDQYLEWKPTGLSPSTYFELRGSADWQPEYNWLEWSGAYYLRVTGKFAFAPLGLGDPMAINDSFYTDSVASGEWVQAEGVSGLTITGGAAYAAGNTFERKVFLAQGRNYNYDDCRVVVRFTTTSTVATSIKIGAQVSNQTGGVASNVSNGAIEGFVTDDGTNTRLKIDVWTGGSANTIANQILGARLAANTTYWVVFRRQGAVVEVELWTTPPTPNQTPTNTTGFVKLTLAQRLPAGKAGFIFIPQSTAVAITDVSIEPYHYRFSVASTYGTTQLPQVVTLPAMPGDVPPKCDVDIGVFGGSQPLFALAAAWPKPATHNKIQNGDFNFDAPSTGAFAFGWSSGGAFVASSTPTAQSLLQDVNPASPVRSRMVYQITTPATAFAGVYYDGLMLEPGKVYYAEAWVRSPSATGQVELALAPAGTTPHQRSATPVTLSASWQKVTLTVDTTIAVAQYPGQFQGPSQFGVRQIAAVAQVIQIAGVSLYESPAGTLPTSLLDTQQDGRGGLPPLGIVDTVSAWTTSGNADATARAGRSWGVSGGVTFGTLEWMIDPNLCTPDEYSAGELDIEFWARWFFKAGSANYTFVLSLQPDSGINNGAARYTTEFGSSGVTPTLPTGDAWRFTRLGTLRMRVNPANPARHRLRFDFTSSVNVATGFKLDYLIGVPLRRRIASPTARAYDSAYPGLFGSAWAAGSDATKTLLADGSGLINYPGPGLERSTSAWPEHGASGALQITPGVPNEVLVKVSTLVPDDPTLSTATEQLAQTGHVAFPIIPRYLLARPT
jgi:hypothetical protein